MTIRHILRTALMTGAAICASQALAQDNMNQSSGPPAADPVEDASGMEVSASLSAATDYIFRGVSQTDGDPAVFASVSLNYNGFYAGAGTENVDFAGVEQEYDLWVGYVAQLGSGTSLDIGAVRYGYVDSVVDIDTTEFKAALSTTQGATGLGIAGYWTPDYFGSNDDAFYGEINASQALMQGLTLSGAVGVQQISAAPDYVTWNAGLRYQLLPGASVDVRYHDSDGSFGNLGGSRFVGSFAASF